LPSSFAAIITGVSATRMRHLAQHTARTVGRRLAEAASRELSRRGQSPGHESHARPAGRDQQIDRPADDAELDSLRVELVSELDRLAMRDPGSSGSFRRI